MSTLDVVEAQCVRNFNVGVFMFPLVDDSEAPFEKWEFKTRICFNGEYAKYFAERKLIHSRPQVNLRSTKTQAPMSVGCPYVHIKYDGNIARYY